LLSSVFSFVSNAETLILALVETSHGCSEVGPHALKKKSESPNLVVGSHRNRRIESSERLPASSMVDLIFVLAITIDTTTPIRIRDYRVVAIGSKLVAMYC